MAPGTIAEMQRQHNTSLATSTGIAAEIQEQHKTSARTQAATPVVHTLPSSYACKQLYCSNSYMQLEEAALDIEMDKNVVQSVPISFIIKCLVLTADDNRAAHGAAVQACPSAVFSWSGYK